MHKGCLVILTCLLAGAAMGAIIHVPSDQATIQAGLDAALENDTIQVAAGTYTDDGNRDLDFHGKRILLVSLAGAGSTVIDAQGSEADPHVGIYFHSGEDSLAIVDGFTVRGSWKKLASPLNFSMMGGITCGACSPTIRNCELTNNAGAGLVSFQGGHPYVTDCSIFANQGNGVRVGVGNIGGSSGITIEHCLVRKNDSVGIKLLYQGDHIIRNCTVVQNTVHGIAYYSDMPVAPEPSEAGAFTQLIEKCIVAYNQGFGIMSSTLGFPVIPVHCSDIYANTVGALYGYGPNSDTTGCVFADPKFCDTLNDQYTIRDNSGASPLVNQCKVLMGAFPIKCTCCNAVYRGNVNGTGIIDLSDLTLLINYLLGRTPALNCQVAGDTNADSVIDIGDLSALICWLTAADSWRCMAVCPTY